MIRSSPAPLRLLSLLLLPLLFSGCLWYLYPSDPSPEILLYEPFLQWIDRDQTWHSGATSGGFEDAQIIDSRLEVYGPRHFLQTRDQFPTDITILLEWSVTNGDVTAQLYPAENLVDPDFAIVIDEIDLTIELSLYQTDPELGQIDVIRIRDEFQRDIVEPVAVPTAGVTRGHLEINLVPVGDDLLVEVLVPELDLVAGATMPDVDAKDSSLTLEASGFRDDPRALEEFFLIRRTPTLGDLQ